MIDLIRKLCESNKEKTMFYKDLEIKPGANGAVSVWCESLLLFRVDPLKTGCCNYYIKPVDEHFRVKDAANPLRIKCEKTEQLGDQIGTLFETLDRYILTNYNSHVFGCCSKYLECSDAKRCLHADELRYASCTYRKNLESGKIFYGKNRNVD